MGASGGLVLSDDDADRTVIIPSPQGRTAAGAGRASATRQIGDVPLPQTSGLNPLLAAANPVLNLVPQIRATAQHPDPLALRDALARDIKVFEARAHEARVAPDAILGARYALCTLLDEAAASTPWGSSGVWAQHSLLAMFHNEAFGGEKFFLLVSKLAQNPQQNRDLLELLYACLALGLEGRYRVVENGPAQLDAVRERLAQILRRERGEYERELSPAWRPATVKGKRLFRIVPLWVVFAVCGALLVTIFVMLSIRLNTASDPLFTQIQRLWIEKAPPAPPTPATPPLATLLKKEIDEGLLTVSDYADRSVVTIVGDGLFPPGSGTVSHRYEPLLGRIATELERLPGAVVVTGHTDNRPIRSARFPSNWHLSRERARAVAETLSATLSAPQRVTYEGHADSQPVASNDTPGGRARNRRVEITLMAASGDTRTATAPLTARPTQRTK
jgi:type VI secretion system protein ImpK